MQLDAVHLAPEEYVEQLHEELLRSGQRIVFSRDRLFGVKGSAYHPLWAQNSWLTPQLLAVSSIADAAKKLKAIQRNWALYQTEERGRAKLIQDALPKVSAKPQVFGKPFPDSPLGGWTMWDRNTLLASSVCSSVFPHGEAIFLEDKVGPPNRAYLKLWEGLSLINKKPCPEDVCVELGSAPGGWTYVLASLGARVFSIDRALLDTKLMHHPLIEHCRGSAFGLEPEIAGEISWFFSDLACYPERLLELVHRWLDKGQCKRFFCTLKFSAKADYAIVDDFLRIPHSKAFHLYANKHEITWVKLPQEEW